MRHVFQLQESIAQLLDLFLNAFPVPTIITVFDNDSRQSQEGDSKMKERAGLVKMKGNPIVLLGNEVKVGDLAPDFEEVDNGLSPVKFSSFRGKVCVLSSVPSLDTPVCDALGFSLFKTLFD